MNRQIKFRVWDKKRNTFLTDKGEYFISSGGKLTFIKAHFIAGMDESDFCWSSTNRDVNSDNFVVQWFTGMQDRKGRKIYEGDIVKYKYIYEYDKTGESIRPVEFYKGSFCPLPVDDINDGDDFYSYRIKDYEIIGNLFENPELLNP